MILLIWDSGMGMRAYKFQEEGEMAKLAIASSGKYINGDDLAEDHPIWDLNDKLPGMAYIDCDQPLIGPFSQVVICGFMP